MKPSIFILVLLSMLPCAQAETPKTLDELVKQVRETHLLEKKENAEREQQFQQARDQQQRLLSEARSELAAIEKHAEELKLIYEQNAQEIERQNTLLTERIGSLGELHGIVRQIAGDIDVIIDTSLVSAQISGRDDLIDELAASKTLPAISELEQLWQLVLEEMVESGKVVTFPANLITNTGNEVEQAVTRIGVFNAVSNGRFLRYQPETGKLAEPGRQPSKRHQSMAQELENADGEIFPFPIDPTRGVLLALLIQSPDLVDRIRQAGIIGYVILALGSLALLIVAERFIILLTVQRKIFRQRESTAIAADNPLGRLRQVERDSAYADAETLGLKLDQAILKEIPKLRRRLPILAVFATAAPLLGLLGTVAGMIETFQSMTLFGAGDPKIVSGGISLALVATELGLVVAIPILLLHGWLHGLSNQIVHVLEEEIAALVARREEMAHPVTERHA